MLLSLLALSGCDNSAAEALLTCAGGNMEACYKEGVSASNAARPRYDEARRAFSSACMNIHHAQSCMELGRLVRDAKGGPRDLHRASELFEIACKGDLPVACVEQGLLLYKDKDGLKAQPERAAVLFSGACEKVDAASTPEDGAHPLASACDALGTAYREGIGVEPPKSDPEKAAQLYLRACDAKFAQGCVNGGNLAAESKKKEDVANAAELYERACKLDARQGCFELATLHEQKAWPGADDQQAAVYFQKTCSIDPTRGCYEAGLLMETERVQAREGEIEYLYNLACEHGNSAACAKRNLQ
ncbi:MAG: sel1 repeat family protein [Alphaproteobacteria bacterium]|nr:sel1 repeat family protein [Alphaproteobacteria bacterium]MCB9698421.1 sel1 repeat family protein [Alphaproteobacteria bacterium]